jgi:hypothetical protein
MPKARPGLVLFFTVTVILNNGFDDKRTADMGFDPGSYNRRDYPSQLR